MKHWKGDRRSLLNSLLGVGVVGWLGSVLYPVVSFLKPPSEEGGNVASVKVGPPSDIASNTGRVIKFGRKPVLLVRTDQGELRAMSATCTHLDCTVQYRDDRTDIWCACHNGIYDLRGKNVSGPPPRPLTPYDVDVVDGAVVVSAPSE